MTEPLNLERWSHETQEVCRITLEKLKKILLAVDVASIEIKDAKSFYNLSNSVAAVTKSVHAMEMATRDRETLAREVRQGFILECKRLMASEPELMQQTLNLLAEAEANVLMQLEKE